MTIRVEARAVPPPDDCRCHGDRPATIELVLPTAGRPDIGIVLPMCDETAQAIVEALRDQLGDLGAP